MFVFKAAVVGAGVMGGEIAQVIAAAGLPVVLKDVEARFVEAGLATAREVTERGLAKLVERGRLAPEAARAQTEAILATNSSGLSITEIGDATSRPEKVVGFHFFWPASRMRLVEVVRGEETSPETLQTAANFAQALRKTAIRCEECPGFVVNRILTSAASEVWRYQEESGAGVEAIDAALVEAGVAPMGPFRLADSSGLDTVVKVAQDLREAYGERFHVHGGMESLVREGRLGRKSGQGFYDYS